MNYKTYAPSIEIAPFVKVFWSLEAEAQTLPEKQTIVPDGCMEMIFHYGDLYRQYLSSGQSIIQPRSFVFGQLTKQLEIEPTGATGIIAARFEPDGFFPFSNLAPNQMENQAIALSDLFGEEGLKLEQNILLATANEERVRIITLFIENQLGTPRVIDNICKASVSLLLKLKGQVSVDELASQIGINKRQLERRFSSAIGLSPKQLSKIVRLQATLKMLEQKKFTSLTALAYENGYFDQAHFIKDFKEFTGVSPRQFYANNLKMSSLFIGTE